MGEAPLSLHLDAKLMELLESEAHRQQSGTDDVARRAIERYLEIQEHHREVLEARIAEADNGVFISEDAMMRWISSWGTENELPPPEPDVFPDAK